MKLTLDRICLSTNDFCLKCSKKLKNGEVSKIDIEVGKTIIKASKQHKSLNTITLEKVIVTKSAVYLIVKPGDVEKFKNAGYVFLNQLSDTVGTEVSFIEKQKNVSKLIETLVAPAVTEKITTVFIPPFGEKELKIQFSEDQRKLIKLSAEELSTILKALYGYGCHYHFN